MSVRLRIRHALGPIVRATRRKVGRWAARVCTHTQAGLDALRLPANVAAHDVSSGEIARAREANAVHWSEAPKRIGSVTFLVPHLKNLLAGGITTVLRTADYLARQGVRIDLAFHNAPRMDVEAARRLIEARFPALSGMRIHALVPGETLPESDVGVATFWPTAFELVRQPGFAARAYMIQDFEPGFYSAGEAYLLAEMSYRLGLRGIVNTPGLESFLRRDYGLLGMSFVPSVNRLVYHDDRRDRTAGGTSRVFFYGRPTQGRNAFGVGLRALRWVKERRGPDVEIVAAGEPWNPSDYGVGGIVRNLGNVQSPEALGRLYRSCDVGVALMATKHPSYLPLELSACGCAVVTNVNRTNRWLLRDGETCRVAEPSGPCLGGAILELLDDPAQRSRLAAGLRAELSDDWSSAMERIHRYLRGGRPAREMEDGRSPGGSSGGDSPGAP